MLLLLLLLLLQVILKANRVTSTKTPLQYDYYDLPFCKRGKSRARADNVGGRVMGDALTASPYEVTFLSSHSLEFIFIGLNDVIMTASSQEG